MTGSRRPPSRQEPPDRHADLNARLVGYLRQAPDRAPAHLLGMAADRVHVTRQRRRRWRFGGTISTWAVVAAAVAIAIITSVRLGIVPDQGVPGTNRPTLATPSIGPGREPIVVQRLATPTIVAAAFDLDGAVWAVLVDGLVFRFDAATGVVLTELDAQLEEPTGAAAGAGAIWLGSADGDLVKVDVASGTIAAEVDVGIAHHAVAASDDAVWVAGGAAARRIDAGTLAVTEFGLPPGVVALAAVADEVWATYPGGRIVVVDGRTAAVEATIQTNPEPAKQPGGILGVAGGDVWLAETAGGGFLHRIDAARHEISGSLAFASPNGPSALAPDAGGTWALLGGDGLLIRIERDGLAVADTIDVGLGARGIGALPNGLGLWGAGGLRVLDVQPGQ